MALKWNSTVWRRILLRALNVAGAAASGLRSPTARARDGKEIKRVLVLELWNIGDIVLTMPFLAQLRVLFPNASVTLLSRPHARELLEGTSLVDEFMEIEMAPGAEWLSDNRFARDWRAVLRACRRIRQHPPDLAFQSRMHIREQLILAMSGARRRIGYGFGHGDRLLTEVVPIEDPDRHRVTDWLRLLEPFGGSGDVSYPSLHVSDDERMWSVDYLSGMGVAPGHILIGVHPGASVAEKRWPIDRFREVVSSLAQRPGIRIIVFADAEGYGTKLGEIPGVIVAKVGLRQLMSLIARCDFLICNDSGPMHIAGGLGVPTVAVFEEGIDRWFAPLGEGHSLVTAKGKSLVEVPAASVMEAVDEQLGRLGAEDGQGFPTATGASAGEGPRDAGRGAS